MLAVGKCGSPFIAVVRRAPDGYGYKSSKLLQQHSIPFLPSGFSLRVLSTYLERWNRRQTSFINYGGRVTDAKDIRTIDVVMAQFYNESVLKVRAVPCRAVPARLLACPSLDSRAHCVSPVSDLYFSG